MKNKHDGSERESAPRAKVGAFTPSEIAAVTTKLRLDPFRRASGLLLLAALAVLIGAHAQPNPEKIGAGPEKPHAERISKSYKLGAYYFGYWGPHFPTDQLRHYEQKFGKSADWWAGVRDLRDSSDVGGGLYQGNFRHLKPALGYYDLSNPRVIEQHIRQAIRYGLSFFNFYFFWDSALGSEKYGDGTSSFLIAENRDAIDFMISIVADAADPIPRQSFDAVADHLVTAYIWRSNYLTVPGGRPLVEILHNQGLGNGSAEDTDAFLRRLREIVRKRLGVNPFFIVSTSAQKFSNVLEADGYTCSDHYWYPEGLKTLVKSYESYIRSIDAYFDLMNRVVGDSSFFYCISSGHDERPRLYLNPGANSKEQIERLRTMLPYYLERSPARFAAALRRVKARMDSRASRWGNYLMIYAWNEWNEGGIIEPDEQNGEAYLAAIAEVFADHRQR